MQNGIRPCSLLHRSGPAKSPGASVHSLGERRDSLASAGNPGISARFATPADVPVPHKSAHKEWWQCCWGAARGGTEGYTAVFKLESLLRSYVVQYGSMICKHPPRMWLWVRRSSPGCEEQQAFKSEGCREPCPKKPMLSPSHPPGNLRCILQRTESGLVLLSYQLYLSGIAADFIKLIPV